MYGSFQLVVHAEDYSLITMSASVIDSTSATISTEWTPYTLANAAGWAAASAGSFGSVGAQWTGAVFNFGSSGTINFASAGLQSVEVAAVDGSGNVLTFLSDKRRYRFGHYYLDSQDAWETAGMARSWSSRSRRRSCWRVHSVWDERLFKCFFLLEITLR